VTGHGRPDSGRRTSAIHADQLPTLRPESQRRPSQHRHHGSDHDAEGHESLDSEIGGDFQVEIVRVLGAAESLQAFGRE